MSMHGLHAFLADLVLTCGHELMFDMACYLASLFYLAKLE